VSGPGSPDRPVPPSGVLSKTEILTHIGEVADELATCGVASTLVVVGGSYMALHDLRESTADVDSLTRLTGELQAAVRAVADRHGLRIDWLNDKAAMFAPTGLRVDDCELLYEHAHLTVLGPQVNRPSTGSRTATGMVRPARRAYLATSGA